ncbi:XRE family transcriptional regulator [Pseudolysinimonas yzui]|uniref:XRE family transcriptional regulator n=2 Tax=Pseudolysinimonas yzui TaxID=2708254 RepID=A0A8J3GRT0_9MICO|nr:XRE family transcriptional regulator [Pseudolysinimonas yzui]
MFVDPRMITLAREAQGWNQTHLAGLLDVTQGYLSKIESGNAEVSDELLAKLAQHLETPAALFSYVGSASTIEVTCLHHRRRASTMSAPTKKRIEALARLTRISVEELMKTVRITTDKSIPRRGDVDLTPADFARVVREYFAIPDGPIENLLSYVERAGVLVVHRPLGTASQDAVSTWPDGGAPMMIVNTGLSPDRERFTVAHELGHLVMHGAPGDDQETEANDFASELLAPAEQIREDLVGLDRRDMGRLMRLKTKWGMSIAALVRRAWSIDELSDEDYKSYQIQLTKLGWRQAEPGHVPAEDATLVRRVIEARRQHESLDDDALAAIALMKPEQFRNVFLPADEAGPKTEVTISA